jgi:hypothetical protein
VLGLETIELLKLGLLPWAQEVRGSNPRAPTKSFQINDLQTVNFGTAVFWCNSRKQL